MRMGSARPAAACAAVALFLVTAACSRDMEEQPSFQPQEAPRKHSPVGSVPRDSRAYVSGPVQKAEARIQQGAQVFVINCSHCHGPDGDGDGPVAFYLAKQPANLSAHVGHHPVDHLYEIVTTGKGEFMPPFKGLLTTEERWAVAYYLKSLGHDQHVH